MSARTDASTRIVIAGGGVAAIEAVLALEAAGHDGLAVTLVSASPEFRLPPLSALKPFARGHSDAVDLRTFMAAHGGEFVHGRLATVVTERKVIVLADATEIAYDELLVAVGGQPVKGTDQGTGFDPESHEAVAGIASDLEMGWAGSVAVVIPEGASWPLPGYEIALQLAHELGGIAHGHDGGGVHLFVPTDEPLPIFGPEGSAAVRDLLVQGGVELHTGAAARVVRTGLVEREGGLAPVKVDRVLAIPQIKGPAIPGLPQDDLAFIPVDERSRVVGVPHVHAAGDGTTQPVKLGTIACQQADTAVADILAELGLGLPVEANAPLYDARLVTVDRELILHHDPSGAGRPGLEWPASGKIAGRYLTPWVEAEGISHVPRRGGG